MATTYTPKFLKRTASQAQFEPPASKKTALDAQPTPKPTTPSPAKVALIPVKAPEPSTFHFPSLRWDPQRQLRKTIDALDDRHVQLLLERAIELALEAIGFEAADPEALQSFRLNVEEYMSQYLYTVRQSMQACRRLQALPQDYLQALHTHQLSLRALLPHLEPPVPPSKSQIRLRKELVRDEEEGHLRLLTSFWKSNSEKEEELDFIPKHFPHLPSKHTYKATPEFLDRDQDPRKLRERATEESKLGEEALRRLVGAAAEARAHKVRQAVRKPTVTEKREELWRSTMQAVAKQGVPEAMDLDKQDARPTARWAGSLGSAVNAEQRFWRKPKKQ